jgi:glycosyltransferase involved in cell wall biosynthesis
MINLLTIVYPKLRTPSGNKTYSDRIIHGLSDAGYEFKKVGIRKIEFSLGGKPVGGIASQKMFTSLHSFRDHPIHSLVPEITPKGGEIVTVHDIIPFIESSKFITSGYDRSAYKLMYGNALNASVIISPTKTGKDQLISNLKLGEDKVRVVYESVDERKFYFDPVNPYRDNGKIHLLTVGDFNPRKRFDILFDIVSKMDDIELYHIGPTNSWSERALQLKKMISDKKNIFMLGIVDDSMLRRYYSHADLFVYISDAEGFGLPPIEAMACGTNVLVNDIPVFRETMGNIGFVSGVENFGESIRLALEKRHDRTLLLEYARNFSIKREIESLIAIYKEFE